ncbi:HIT family protein [Arcanobacterium pinnipediorum]|uniref:HIT family protein n=1 Tax=Arcanobacterium pinnipediorum TaxID=1503041 RepID=A0ABY5AGB4_9ACTO|nr:HIT family protein [Arcanobacterium pinnipediorum]USR78761.1 HIT family protein [Arcanobacterium pinnipediorum]
MSSIFTKIIAGEIPGKFVWADDDVVAMATIEPSRPGHVMVIPRGEVAKFNDVEPEVFAHAMKVAQIIATAQERAFDVERSVVTILGFDVPHTHIHVIPADSPNAADLHNASAAPAADITQAMMDLRNALVELGYGEHVPEYMDAL